MHPFEDLTNCDGSMMIISSRVFTLSLSRSRSRSHALIHYFQLTRWYTPQKTPIRQSPRTLLIGRFRSALDVHLSLPSISVQKPFIARLRPIITCTDFPFACELVRARSIANGSALRVFLIRPGTGNRQIRPRIKPWLCSFFFSFPVFNDCITGFNKRVRFFFFLFGGREMLCSLIHSSTIGRGQIMIFAEMNAKSTNFAVFGGKLGHNMADKSRCSDTMSYRDRFKHCGKNFRQVMSPWINGWFYRIWGGLGGKKQIWSGCRGKVWCRM